MPKKDYYNVTVSVKAGVTDQLRRRLALDSDSEMMRRALQALDYLTAGHGTIYVKRDKHQSWVCYRERGSDERELFMCYPETDTIAKAQLDAMLAWDKVINLRNDLERLSREPQTIENLQACVELQKHLLHLVDEIDKVHGVMLRLREQERQDSDEAPDVEPDWTKKCIVCEGTPVLPATGMCGPCTFGEAETAGGNW